MNNKEEIIRFRQDVKRELLKIEFVEGHYTEAEAEEAINIFSDEDLIEHMKTLSAVQMAKFISRYF